MNRLAREEMSFFCKLGLFYDDKNLLQRSKFFFSFKETPFLKGLQLQEVRCLTS